MRHYLFGLAAACALAILSGCSAQPANVAGEVRREDGLYLVKSVHAQEDGYFLVNLIGRKADHRLGIRIRPRPNEPVPELGETWNVACDNYGFARLVGRQAAGGAP